MAGRFIVAFVASRSDLVDLVSDRVRAGQAIQEDAGKDYLVYQQVDGNPIGDLSPGTTGVTVDRYQVSIVSAGGKPRDYTRIRKIARLLAGTLGDQRLNGFRGSLGGVMVQSCRLADQRDSPSAPIHAGGTGIHEIQQDYVIAWNECEAAVP